MRDYSKVAPAFWTGDTGRRLRAAGPECQLLALFLLTGPSANMIGLYHLPVEVIALYLGCPLEGASKALRRVCATGFAFHDPIREEVYVPQMAAHQIGATLSPMDKRVKGVARELSNFRKSAFYMDFHERYREAYHLPEPCCCRPEASPLEGASKPLRSQEQEQEQEQEEPPPAPPPGGEGSKSAGKKEKPPRALPLPAALQTDAFRAAWADWRAYRTERRHTLTESTARAQLASCARMGAEAAVASIRRSIEAGWLRLIPPKDAGGLFSRETPPREDLDEKVRRRRAARAAEEAAAGRPQEEDA